MKVLILSSDGDGIGIAQRLVEEGNKVYMFIKDKQFKHAGVGMFKRVDSWRPYLAESDLVICDMVGFGHLEQTFRRLGKVFLGCSAIADMIELDRAKGIELFKKSGINIPETYEFDSPDDAKMIADIWEDPGFVIKPSGNISTSKTSVCYNRESYLWNLDNLPSDTKLIVQKIIEGVEVSTEGWFNGRDWIKPFNHTFEEKRLFDGGIGPNTGCMGNIVMTTAVNKLVEHTILKLTKFMQHISYRGPVDINCIVTEDSVYGLELTPRFGYDAIEALMEGINGLERITDFLFEVAAGVKKTMNITRDFMIAVRLSVSPWPHGEPDQSERGMPILGIIPENIKHIYLTDVYKEDDIYKYAAGDGVIAKVTARGRDISEATNRVYSTIRNLSIPDVQYRTDIGKRAKADIEQLKSWGWLNA